MARLGPRLRLSHKAGLGSAGEGPLLGSLLWLLAGVTPRRLLAKSLLFSWLLTEGHPLSSLLRGAVLGAAHNMETVFIRESK